jgi:hypothetical protein
MGVPPTLQRQDSGGNGAWAHLDPRSELERVLSLAQPYNPQPKEEPQSQSEGGQS